MSSLYIYISGLGSSGDRVKPNMAASGGLSYVSLPTRFIRVTEMALGDYNYQNALPVS